MGSFAALRIPLDLTRRRGAGIVAREVIENFPGTRNVELDDATGALAFEMLFPGNLSALIHQLAENLIPAGSRAQISLPVQSLAPELVAGGSRTLGERVDAGPEIWDPEFARGQYVAEARLNGNCVEASIVASSSAMHEMYDVLLSLGMVASEP